MSRCTQYIGLNRRAWDFLEKNNYKELAQYIGDTGMFEEPIYYGIYEVEIKSQDHSYSIFDEDGNETNVFENIKIETYVETTQAEIWSGGPMYFTCLKNILTGDIIGKWEDEEMS